MTRFIQIKDEHSKILGRRFLNSQLSFYIGIIQLFICLWALVQHVYSLIVFDTILFCDFSNNSTLPTILIGVDAIIFDIGLFHSLWGISGCVAEHLDGGYGRFAWCVCHILALVLCLPCAFMNRVKPFFMWPLLIQQSAYGIGLLILSLAALPRILPTFMGKLDNAPIGAIFVYVLGTLMNFFLLFVYWHWYWHVESCYNSVLKVKTSRVLESHGRRSVEVRRTPIEPTPQKLLSNGCIETRTPLITKADNISISNGNPKAQAQVQTQVQAQVQTQVQAQAQAQAHLKTTVSNALHKPAKPNGAVHANGHVRTIVVTQPVNPYTKISNNSAAMSPPHVTASVDSVDAKTRRQSELEMYDDLSPNESSISSFGQQPLKQRRRLPNIGIKHPYRPFSSPYIQSKPSTVSLPIPKINEDHANRLHTDYRRPVEFYSTPNEFGSRRDNSSTREVCTSDLVSHNPYVKHRASLQQQQQPVEPALRQVRRYQSHLAGMSPLSIRYVPYSSDSPSTQQVRIVQKQPKPAINEFPFKMTQYNFTQQQITETSDEFDDYDQDAPSPRNQRFYSAAL